MSDSTEKPTPHDIEKTWAVVSGDEILLQEDTKPELKRRMEQVQLPADYEVVALPKPHGTVILG